MKLCSREYTCLVDGACSSLADEPKLVFFLNAFMFNSLDTLANVLSACTPRARMSLMYFFWFRRVASSLCSCVGVGLISPHCIFMERYWHFLIFQCQFTNLFSLKRISKSVSLHIMVYNEVLCISPLACLSPRPFPSCPLPHPNHPGFPSTSARALPAFQRLARLAASPHARSSQGRNLACWFGWCGNGRTYWV